MNITVLFKIFHFLWWILKWSFNAFKFQVKAKFFNNNKLRILVNFIVFQIDKLNYEWKNRIINDYYITKSIWWYFSFEFLISSTSRFPHALSRGYSVLAFCFADYSKINFIQKKLCLDSSITKFAIILNLIKIGLKFICIFIYIQSALKRHFIYW